MLILMKRKSMKTKILVVDDDDAVTELLCEFLGETDYTIRTASNGRNALGILEEWLPDVILMDIQMPIMDGIETCKKIKENTLTQRIPVILASAMDFMVASGKARLAGADFFLPKPFKFYELMRILETVNPPGA